MAPTSWDADARVVRAMVHTLRHPTTPPALLTPKMRETVQQAIDALVILDAMYQVAAMQARRHKD